MLKTFLMRRKCDCSFVPPTQLPQEPMSSKEPEQMEIENKIILFLCVCSLVFLMLFLIKIDKRVLYLEEVEQSNILKPNNPTNP